MTHEQAAFETYFQGSFSVRALDVVVVGFSLAFVVAYVDRLYNGDDGSLVWLLVWAAFFGVVRAMFMMVGNERRLRRNFGSVDQYAAYIQALKTGELPARIDPVVWRAWLRRSRQRRLMGPLWLLLLVAFGLLPSLISQSAYWVTATASGLLTLSNLFGWWRSRGKIARLAAEVERHAPRGSTV